MTQIPYFTPETTGFRNRSTMLLVVGILFIIVGALAGCLGLFVPLTLVLPRPQNAPPPKIAYIATALAMYVLAAAVFIALGVGAVRKRSWVAPLVLAISWITLASGVMGIGSLAIKAPGFAAGMRQSMTTAAPGTPTLPPAMVNMMLAGMALVALFSYLVIPSVLIWLFKDDSVRATLAFYDPKPRWTDRLPLTVLILILALAGSSLFALAAMAQHWIPAFGTVLYGLPAAIAACALAILFAISAWLCYRLRVAGWRLAIILWVAYGISWILTLWFADMRKVFQQAGIDERQLRIMEQTHALPDRVTAILSALFILVVIVFTLRIRRHFVAGDAAAS